MRERTEMGVTLTLIASAVAVACDLSPHRAIAQRVTRTGDGAHHRRSHDDG